MDNELRARIEELERRVVALEQAAGGTMPAAAAAQAMTSAALPSTVPMLNASVMQVAAQDVASPTEPVSVPPTAPPTRPPAGRAGTTGSLPEFLSREAARRQDAAKPGTVDMTFEEFVATRQARAGEGQSSVPHAARSVKPRTALDIESLVGGHWFAIAGGLVVLLGLVFFFQFAIREGWIQKISPAMRCGMGGMLGLGFLATGEFLKRKLNAWAAVGVSGAGVGALFISTLVAYSGFGLLSPTAALVLIAASAAIGIVQSLRLNVLAVAHIALGGAAFAPLLLHTAQPNVNPLSAYYLVLLVTGLLLAAIRGGTFGTLRWTSSASVMLTGAVCALQSSAIPWVWAVFAGVCGALMHVEQAYSGARLDAKENLDGEQATDGPRPSIVARMNTNLGEGVNLVLLFVATLWAVTLATLMMNTDATGPQWLPSAAAGVATLIGAFMLAGSATSLRDMPSTRKGLIAISELTQTGALLIATVALALSNQVQLIAWLTLGAAAIVAGRSINWRPLRVFGAVLGLIASGRLLVYEPAFGGLFSGGVVFHGLVLTSWTWLMVAASVLWVLVGLSVKRNADETHAQLGVAAGLFGLLHLSAAVLNVRAEPAAVMTYWIVLSAALLAASKPLRAIMPKVAVLTMMLFVSLRLCLFEPWSGQLVTGGTEFHGLVLTTWTWLMAAAAVIWVLLGLSLTSKRLEVATALLGTLGVGHLAASVLNSQTESASLMWYWMAMGAALLAARKPLRAMLPEASSLLVAMAAMLAWAVAYVFSGWDESNAPVLMHPGLLGGLLNTALLCAGFWLCRGYAEAKSGKDQLALVTGLVALGLALMVTSLEVARSAAILTSDGTMRTAAVSIWWGVVALGLLVGGTVLHSAFARRAGLALLSIATAKAILLDTREVTAGWRAITVLVLGGLMLGVGVAYARIGKALDAEKKGEDMH